MTAALGVRSRAVAARTAPRPRLEQLAAERGVCGRTIRRDIDALCRAGFPLRDEKVNGTTMWKLASRPFGRLEQTGLSLTELCALYFSRAGIDVGYQGLASGLQDVVLPAFQLSVLIFSIGVLVAGLRGHDPAERRPDLAAGRIAIAVRLRGNGTNPGPESDSGADRRLRQLPSLRALPRVHAEPVRI